MARVKKCTDGSGTEAAKMAKQKIPGTKACGAPFQACRIRDKDYPDWKWSALALMNSSTAGDCQVKMQDGLKPAHKVFLSRSKKFAKEFTGGANMVSLETEETAVAAVLLRFLYSDEVSLSLTSDEQLFQLLAASIAHGLAPLVRPVETKLLAGTTITNAVTRLTTAARLRRVRLKRAYLRFMQNNFKELERTKSLEQLQEHPELLQELLDMCFEEPAPALFTFGRASAPALVTPRVDSAASCLSLSAHLQKELAASKYCDLQVVLNGGAVIKAHSAIFRAHNSAFDGMLSHGMKEATEKKIDLQEFSADGAKLFVQSLYSRDLAEKAKEHVVELVELADRYQVGFLMALCVDSAAQDFCKADLTWGKVRSILSTGLLGYNKYPEHVARARQNVIPLVLLAEKLQIGDLEWVALEFIKRRYTELQSSDAFKSELSAHPELMLRILKHKMGSSIQPQAAPPPRKRQRI
jgi:hypothetical protein